MLYLLTTPHFSQEDLFRVFFKPQMGGGGSKEKKKEGMKIGENRKKTVL